MDVIVTGRRCIIYNKETFFSGQTIDDMDDREAVRLLQKGHVRKAADDDPVIAASPPLEEMTKAQLRDLLDKLAVEYPADAKKADLIALVEKHTAEPPEE